MRIAVYHDLPPGGALRLLTETLRLLRHHELQLFEIARPGTEEARSVLAACVDNVHRVAMTQRAGAAARALEPALAVARARRAERAIASSIDAGGFDVALVHPSMVMQAPSLLTRLRTPSLYYAHETRRLSHEASYIATRRHGHGKLLPRRAAAAALEMALRRSDDAAMRTATTIACNSQFTAEALYRAYGRTALVCAPGVDSRMFAPAETPRVQPPYVVAVGALDPVKNHGTVVEALGLLPLAVRPALHVVYERAMPDEERRLRALAQRHAVTLHLHHGIEDAALVALYRGATATICASRMEPFGLTALESLSTGTPVVAVREGGFRETVRDGAGGVLVDPTADALAAGIRRIVDGELDADSMRIRATVADFTWARTASCLDAALAATAAGGRR